MAPALPAASTRGGIVGTDTSARVRRHGAKHADRVAIGHGHCPVTLVAVYPSVLIAASICASVTFAGSYVTTAVPFS